MYKHTLKTECSVQHYVPCVDLL